MKQMTFLNGDIPNFNDSTQLIAPTTDDLIQYAERLNIEPKIVPFNESGYRCFNNSKYELKVDVGNIGPDYIPGHAHSDTFNFVLNIDNQPFIIDTSISTYEKNGQRQFERSTQAHNTVQIGNKEQSEVWGGFRVAKRAYSKILNESTNIIEAHHNGYLRIGALHKRQFEITENQLIIEDNIKTAADMPLKAYLHFHPSVDVNLIKNQAITLNGVIDIYQSDYINIVDCNIATGFNKLQSSKKIEIGFKNQLKIVIRSNPK
jgi:uncharacterized heparinase superfamily protein